MSLFQTERGRKIKPILTDAIKVFALAALYHLAARLGLSMAYVQANTSPVWPPTGIGLAALLILGSRYWPGITLGVLLGSLLTGAPLNLAVGMSIGNTLEAVVAVYCLDKIVGLHRDMDRIRDVVGLVLVALICTIIGASFGTTTLMLTGNGDWQSFWAIWFTWWIGDLLGALVVAPLLLTWRSLPAGRANRRAFVEGGILLVLVATVTWFVFSSLPPIGVFHQAMIYVVFPFVIWAALRFGQRGATMAIAIVSGIAIWGTSQGMGPFSLESTNDSLVLLQTFMAVVTLTALILAAATIERRKATDALRQRADDLATLNDSSKSFLDNFEIASIFQTICRLAVTRLGLDIAWIETKDQYETADPRIIAFGASPGLIGSLKEKWPELGAAQTLAAPSVKELGAGLPADGSPDRAYRAYAVFPLLFSNRLVGTLRLLSRQRDFFTHDSQILLQSYANLAAVAIQNTLLFDEVRRSNRQLHGLSQRLMKAQEAERLHLSRELHDESGQLLTALTVQLGLLERSLGQPATLRERIDELKHTANTIQENLHKLAVNLRPASLDHVGLVTTLQQFIAEFNRQYGIPVDLEAVGMEGKRLPLEVETAFFRIVQESLTNVVHHAQASRVDILLNLRDHHVVMIVEDDGVGFLPSSPGLKDHLGLFGMRERIEMLGGTFVIESSPGKGTTVKAEVPCHD
jgi:signal transduction histidine kinase